MFIVRTYGDDDTFSTDWVSIGIPSSQTLNRFNVGLENKNHVYVSLRYANDRSQLFATKHGIREPS